MKGIKILQILVVIAIVGFVWAWTIVRLDQLKHEITSIEARPLALQDDTKRCLEDLCRKVASESAFETQNAMLDKIKSSCNQVVEEVVKSQRVVGNLAYAVSNDWNKACGEMLSDGRDCLRLVKDESAKLCETVREDSKKSLQATEKMIAEIADQMKIKSDAYLAAARENTNDYQVCELLYRAAILFAENKKPILSEYATLCRQSVKDLIDCGRVDEARSRSASLVEFFDGVIGTGSVSDIRSIPELTGQLTAVKNLVDTAQSRADDIQMAILNEVEGEIRSATNYTQCVDCREKLLNIDLPTDMIYRKDQIEQQISTKMSILSTASDPLSLPPIGEDTPWVAWLENYKTRLTSDKLSDEVRAGEFASVGEFLAAAKKVKSEKVRSAVMEVERLGVEICRNVWRKSVLDATSKANDSRDEMQKCVDMLAASAEFSEEEKELCRDEIITLNRVVITASLRDIQQQAESAKVLEPKLSMDEYTQLLSMVQGQYFNILLSLQSLNQRFKGNFDADIDRVSAAISGFTSVMTGFRKKREVSDMNNQKEREQRFLNWVNLQIEIANRYYENGENIAKKWFATTSNDDAQSNYRKAWEEIMEVNSGDLHALDPALGMRWNKIKEKIEKRYTPKGGDLTNRTYRGIDSFR